MKLSISCGAPTYNLEMFDTYHRNVTTPSALSGKNKQYCIRNTRIGAPGSTWRKYSMQNQKCYQPTRPRMAFTKMLVAGKPKFRFVMERKLPCSSTHCSYTFSSSQHDERIRFWILHAIWTFVGIFCAQCRWEWGCKQVCIVDTLFLILAWKIDLVGEIAVHFGEGCKLWTSPEQNFKTFVNDAAFPSAPSIRDIYRNCCK